ncbi:hypothetical protein [Phytomonospora endophytica]|uniref:Uncharacterized protein n=1 Tax=Phytomonospora endophytica TaxID=714109 RepID=A0A841FQG6_9ACTN|nr:hypothetical protein [Phytomonospora endophytica]MBB6039531.1 hypothetical protein [Phytomonospora endophytica]GIG70495.1 hypothetical protein Pen01_67900 [Phytomonospora endophytica]
MPGFVSRIRPSKPAAVFGAVAGVALLVFGFVTFGTDAGAFIWLWGAFGVGIIAFNLWAAFSRKGASEVVESDERA